MDNNDILRRLRYTFDYDDSKRMGLFELGDYFASRAEVSAWLKKEDHKAFEEMPDKMLASFLNGLIIEKRGEREGPKPVAEDKLDNNLILKKLKIALALKTEDISQIFFLSGRKVSVHEVSAFLRNPKQNQFKTCNDQYLRNFLSGLKDRYRK
jgi:uncharacterized protein YehS (DUF1456 family)